MDGSPVPRHGGWLLEWWSAGKGVNLTCVRLVVRSAVRPLGCRPDLCQVGRM
ncbi:hypothetical protein B296_00052644, partial [Ensete ventricosum]